MGRPTKAWQERVEVLAHLIATYNAFNDLNASRVISDFGEGPIPLSEIRAYCDLFGITDLDDRADFVRCIRAMDTAYLEHRAEERKRQQPSAGKAAR